MTSYPSAPTTFEDLLKPLPKHACEITILLRKIIRSKLPEADEHVSGGQKIGMLLYSIEGANNVVCGVQPTEDHCKLFFHGWKEIQKRGFKLEGSGKNARHVKFRVPSDVNPDDLIEMINIARNAMRQ